MSDSPRPLSRARSRLAVGVLAGLLTTAAAPASAIEDRDPSPRISAASLTLVGHGYGHGHGMSQWGAQGAARQGKTYRQILRFYYPGLSCGKASGRVSVLVGADTSDDLIVGAREGLRVQSLGSGRKLRLAKPKVKRWRITAAKSGRSSKISMRTGGSWKTWRTVPGQAQFSASGKPITLITPRGPIKYRGILRSAAPRETGRKRDTVNVLGLEDYLKGVVPQEVPATWHPQAVAAQAVAARTYAAYERRRPLARHYQLCDTTQCQVYGGYSAEHPSSNAAIRRTRGQILRAGGQPAFTQFSASSGGWTSAGAFSYLPAKADPHDRWAGNPYRDWSQTLSAATIQRAFPAIGAFSSVSVVSRDGNGQWGGRVTRIRITGSTGSGVVSGEDFRSIFGLRSSWFNPQ